MEIKEFVGKWLGSYTYGNEYDEPVKGKTVAFEMTLTLVNGQLKGECTDEESGAHFQEPASIEGSVYDNSISFVKRYPYYWQHEQNGPRFIPKLPSQEILYSGQFVNDRLEGEWEIITILADAHGELVSFKSYGSWSMQKAV